jgi:hypothetical protein
MGKTRLIVELLNNLKTKNNHSQYIVGYSEATNEDQDLLLRAIQSLYFYWMEENSLFSQAKQLWEKNKKDLIGRLGLITAKLFETVFKESFGSASSLISDTLKTLVTEQQSQLLAIPKLSYQQCFELVCDLYTISERPIVLALDAFEQLPEPLTLKTILSKIMLFIDKWPPLHIFISVRNTCPKYIASNEWYAWKCIEDLKKESSLINIFELGILSNDEDNDDFIKFVHEKVPATQHISDEVIMDIIQGHPGVIRRWIDAQPDTLEMMYEKAKDAFEYKYPEIEEIYVKLSEDQDQLFLTAIYYALAPELNSINRWNELKKTININGIDHNTAILKLNGIGLLSEQSYPSFGLTTRYQVARDIVIKTFRLYCVNILKEWERELRVLKGPYILYVSRYVSTLLNTFEPDIAEQQLRLRFNSTLKQVHDIVTPEVMQNLTSLR